MYEIRRVHPVQYLENIAPINRIIRLVRFSYWPFELTLCRRYRHNFELNLELVRTSKKAEINIQKKKTFQVLIYSKLNEKRTFNYL